MGEKEKGNFTVYMEGTRGSCARSGPVTRQFGGNTPCVGVDCGGSLFILDLGTGIVNLCKSMVGWIEADEINVFLTHYHFDHIQGLPFFDFSGNKKTRINVYGGAVEGKSCDELLSAVFCPPFFPVNLIEENAARFSFFELNASEPYTFDNGTAVSAVPVKHTDACFGIKITYRQKTLCYLTDIELGVDSGLDGAAALFAENADVLIIDAHFADDNAACRWGHSTWRRAVDFAKDTGAGKVFLFHHNIYSEDGELNRMYDAYKLRCDNLYMAKDGLVIDL